MQSLGRYPALTGQRGVAAAWVFVHHWNLFAFGSGRGVYALAVGYLAVDAFFLLSGFLMTHSRYDAFQRASVWEFLAYTAERLVRLLPANTAAMLLYAVAFGVVPGIAAEWPGHVHSAFSFATSFFLVQAWLPYPLGAWIAPGWSVSVELGAYCALPAVLFVLRRIVIRVVVGQQITSPARAL